MICALTIAVKVNGVLAVVSLSVSRRPVGLDRRVRVTVFGFRVTLALSEICQPAPIGVRGLKLDDQGRRVVVVGGGERA